MARVTKAASAAEAAPTDGAAAAEAGPVGAHELPAFLRPAAAAPGDAPVSLDGGEPVAVSTGTALPDDLHVEIEQVWIRVRATQPSRRRAGREFGPAPTEIRLLDLSEPELDDLLADPALVVEGPLTL